MCQFCLACVLNWNISLSRFQVVYTANTFCYLESKSEMLKRPEFVCSTGFGGVSVLMHCIALAPWEYDKAIPR